MFPELRRDLVKPIYEPDGTYALADQLISEFAFYQRSLEFIASIIAFPLTHDSPCLSLYMICPLGHGLVLFARRRSRCAIFLFIFVQSSPAVLQMRDCKYRSSSGVSGAHPTKIKAIKMIMYLIFSSSFQLKPSAKSVVHCVPLNTISAVFAFVFDCERRTSISAFVASFDEINSSLYPIAILWCLFPVAFERLHVQVVERCCCTCS